MDDWTGGIIDLIKLGRLQFLFGGLLLYILGVMIAIQMGYSSDIYRAIFGYLVFAPSHLSVSYSNDIFDMHADSFNDGSPFSGGSGVLQRKPQLRTSALVLSVMLILVSIISSGVFVLVYSITPFYVLLVLVGGLLGWFYTAPPLKLSYRGLGEISTAATVGILVPFFGFFTMAGELITDLLLLFIPMGLSGIVFILIVQTPDREADREGGKNTWLVKIGRKRAFILLFFTILGQTIYYLFLQISGIRPGGMEIWPLLVATLIPLLASLPGLVLHPEARDPSTRLITMDMIALFLFLGVSDLFYLLIL